MQSTTLMPVEFYLQTAYSPDVDYVEGEIQERNLGEVDHSATQLEIGILLSRFRAELGLRVYTAQRVQVKADRFRVPDVCAVLQKPDGPILREPPFLVVEGLSREDTMHRVEDRIHDYLEFGVPHVWLIDPGHRRAFDCTKDGWRIEQVLRTQNPEVVLDISEVFAALE